MRVPDGLLTLVQIQVVWPDNATRGAYYDGWVSEDRPVTARVSLRDSYASLAL